MFKVGLLYTKWTFFIHQWTDRIEQFKNDIRLTTEVDRTVTGLAMILTVLTHDCVFKMLKIFFFSRYKPASLNFTTTQLIGPIIDVLLVLVRNLIETRLSILTEVQGS